MAGEGLTEKQKKFAERYAGNGGNATEAASFAGYAHPDTESGRLLGNVRISEYIKTLIQPEHDNLIADARERQQILTKIIRNDEEKTTDRVKAIEVLGKMQGDFIEKHQITSDSNISINVIFPESNAD